MTLTFYIFLSLCQFLLSAKFVIHFCFLTLGLGILVLCLVQDAKRSDQTREEKLIAVNRIIYLSNIVSLILVSCPVIIEAVTLVCIKTYLIIQTPLTLRLLDIAVSLLLRHLIASMILYALTYIIICWLKTYYWFDQIDCVTKGVTISAIVLYFLKLQIYLCVIMLLLISVSKLHHLTIVKYAKYMERKNNLK
jgi:hypothetical protein